MKDQISNDLLAGGFKVAPAIIGSAVSAAKGWTLADVAVLLTILYTLILTTTTVVKNWGLWMDWWAARAADMRRIWRWARSRG